MGAQRLRHLVFLDRFPALAGADVRAVDGNRVGIVAGDAQPGLRRPLVQIERSAEPTVGRKFLTWIPNPESGRTENSTAGFDRGYDAYKLGGLNDAPQLYTMVAYQKITCNALPFVNTGTVVPMGFSCGVGGTYSLTADNLNTFADSIAVSLEDLKLNVFQNLKTNPVYGFTYMVNEDPNRFLLHFDKAPVGIQERENEKAVQIYSYKNTVYLNTLSGNVLKGNVYVFDMLGKDLYHQVLPNQQLTKITLNVTDGYYVVKVVTEKGVETAKVYLGR